MRWLVPGIVVIASCRKGVDRREDEVTRAMALGSIADVDRAIATAATRVGTTDGAQGLARCASVAVTRNDLHETPYRDLAGKLDQLCDTDLPAAELTAALALVEAEPTRCAALAMGPQLQLLAQATAPKIRAPVARYLVLCPTTITSPAIPDHGADGAVPERALGRDP
ncbi:MAG: hypothetical protein WKG01_05990 [Kofleriaceae bacterium]